MPKKTAGLVIILLAAGFFMLLNGCTQTSFTYGIIGTPAISNNGQYVTVLVAESKGITRQINGGYRATDYNSSYWLKQYETATGKLLKKKKIITAAEGKNLLVVCYGGYADKIWLYSNGLKAYSISNLEELVNEESLAAGNGFSKNDFPPDQRFIDVQVAEGYIDFTTASGNTYRIDLSSLKICNRIDAAKKPADAITNQQRFLNTENINYGIRCDTLNGQIYILAKDSVNAMGSRPGDNYAEPVYRRLHLFTANYTTVNAGNRRFYRYSNMKQLAGEAYINGTFLKDFRTDKIIKSKTALVYFILHNDTLSSEAKSVLTAINNNNKIVWQINTGVGTKIASSVAVNKYYLISGNKHNLVSPHLGSDRLCVINLQNGKMAVPSLAD